MGLTVGQVGRDLRRGGKQALTSGLLSAPGRLTPQGAIALGAAIGAGAGAILPLRIRLARNMALGLHPGLTPEGAVSNFFRNLGRVCGWSMAIYHHGFWTRGSPKRSRSTTRWRISTTPSRGVVA